MSKKTMAVSTGMDSRERASDLATHLTNTVGRAVSASLAMHAAMVYAQKNLDEFGEWYAAQHALQPRVGRPRNVPEYDE